MGVVDRLKEALRAKRAERRAPGVVFVPPGIGSQGHHGHHGHGHHGHGHHGHGHQGGHGHHGGGHHVGGEGAGHGG